MISTIIYIDCFLRYKMKLIVLNCKIGGMERGYKIVEEI